MAQEAQISDTTIEFYQQELKAFEALVRADEREACAKVCESEAEMFKSCAEGANDGRYDWKEDGARDCAYAIRARSEK
jgi:predicted ArsR family transcriptional regulator